MVAKAGSVLLWKHVQSCGGDLRQQWNTHEADANEERANELEKSMTIVKP